MSNPEPPHDAHDVHDVHDVTVPAGWYPTGEIGPDGRPLERWWDGAQWNATVRPPSTGTNAPGRSSRTKSLIAAGVIVVLAGGAVGTYFALHHSGPTSTAPVSSQSTPTTGSGNGGGPGGPTASPAPTITGGSGQTVSDPIDGLTIPVPSGWTATSGSTSGQGTWPTLITGPYTCPSALAQANGTSSTAQCTRGGVNLTTTSGTAPQSVATSDIAALAKNDYGNLTSHSVVSQGAVTVAGRAGYQITWSVVPSYSGPSGTVEAIAVPVPGQSGYFTLIDIGVDQSPQAPSLSSVNTQIISNITTSNAAGA